MKFDIVRAWKDEAYRQSLSDEQISTLPEHPAGELELSNTDLESVNGGGLSNGSAASSAVNERFHSLAFSCRELAFSLTVSSGFSFLSPVNAFCINDD